MTKNAKRETGRGSRKYVDFDDYLAQHGIREEIDFAVEKRMIAREIEAALRERSLNKATFARLVGTSRAQIDRILDPLEQNVSVLTLKRVALALGKRLQVSFVEP